MNSTQKTFIELTDRELLTLAARAINFDLDEYSRRLKDDWINFWDPLENDGDALRLAVKLGFVNPGCFPNVAREMEQLILEGNPDWELATRRAIVKAATEVGRKMK